MRNWLEAQAVSSPDKVYLIEGNMRLKFNEVNDRASKIALHLSEHGVEKGNHVAILLHTSIDYVCLIHALIKLQAILIPLNNRLTSNDIQDQIKFADCSFLITSDEFLESYDLNSSIQRILLSEILTNLKLSKNGIYDTYIDLNQIHSIIFTSGTTGKSKAVQLTYANHFYSAISSNFRLQHFENDIWLNPIPLYHVGGLSILFRTCLYGTSTYLMLKFDQEHFGEILLKNKITLISLVPTMLSRVIEDILQIKENLSLRLILLGGAKVPEQLISKCIKEGISISLSYGMTEGSSQLVTSTADEVSTKFGSEGRPLLFTEISIVKDNVLLKPGEIGEIYVKSLSLTPGYYKNDELNKRKFTDLGFQTGDLGYVDEDGYLFVVQRRKDLIISGGENIYPQEVENALLKIDFIEETVVLGIEDKDWGQKVIALIKLKADVYQKEIVDNKAHKFKDKEILSKITSQLKELLASYKIPKEYFIVSEFPKTGSGKIKRELVKDLIS